MYESAPLKVAVTGDSPLITSGFGNVIRMAVDGFVEAGYDVYVQGGLDIFPDFKRIKELPYTYYPTYPEDASGERSLAKFLKDVEPDRVFIVGDPGTIRRKLGFIPRTDGMFTIGYFPIEGRPLFPAVFEAGAALDAPITYCKFGQEEFKKRNISVGQTYHGWDHAEFEQYPEEERKKLREVFGLSEVFMVGMVGVNKRVNNYPRIFDAMRLLKETHPNEYKEIMIYMHCKPFDGHIMAGYDLSWMADGFGVEDGYIFLKPDPGNAYKYSGEGYSGNDLSSFLRDTFKFEGTLTKDVLLSMEKPSRVEHRGALWTAAPFIVKLNCFDMLLDIASVHGFNLPAIEAAMCGVPVATVNDDAARTEIYGDVAYMMEPTSHDYWHLGTRLVHVDEETIVNTLLDFKNNPELREAISANMRYKFDDWTWEKAQTMFNEVVAIGSIYV